MKKKNRKRQRAKVTTVSRKVPTSISSIITPAQPMPLPTQVQGAGAPVRPSSQLHQFLKSNLGAGAFICVLGLLLTLMNNFGQGIIRNHELKNETVGEQRKRDGDEMNHALELIGDCIYESGNLIELTGPNFAPEKYPGVEKQRAEMKEAYNKCAESWAKEKPKLDFLISHYRQSRPEVASTWERLYKAVNQYSDCAHRWHMSHLTPTEIEGACGDEKTEVDQQLAQFNEIFNRSET